MHVLAYEYVYRVLGPNVKPARILEIGARIVNGSIRDLFPEAAQYWGVDLVAGPGVDQIADGAIVVPPFVPDCVICCEVLEHARRPAAIVAHAIDLLASNGLLVITCATDPREPHAALMGAKPYPGEHYRNIDPAELEAWLATPALAYRELELDRRVGDLYAFGVKA